LPQICTGRAQWARLRPATCALGGAVRVVRGGALHDIGAAAEYPV